MSYHTERSSEAKQRKLRLQKERRVKIKLEVRNYKAANGCFCCGEKEPVCLDFHHLDSSEKEVAIANALTNGWSFKRIKKEIDKCVILCANCHRKVHAEILSVG